MKTGDLVRSTTPGNTRLWVGIIIGWDVDNPIVFWDEKFPDEVEYREQLEVLSASS